MATAGTLRTDSFWATCLASDAVGHAVRISGDMAAGLYQVTSVDIDAADLDEARAIGIIAAKPTSTTCQVQTAGVLRGVISGATPGRVLYVATDATLSETPPPRPAAGKRLIQSIAYAVASDAAVISLYFRVRAIAD